jgi:hypothetical protein
MCSGRGAGPAEEDVVQEPEELAADAVLRHDKVSRRARRSSLGGGAAGDELQGGVGEELEDGVGAQGIVVGLRAGVYDPGRPLVIDPALSYSTYLGGSGGITGTASIAVDGAGDAYITGEAAGGFPATAGALQTTSPAPDCAFVTKLYPGGTALVYSTFVSGGISGGAGDRRGRRRRCLRHPRRQLGLSRHGGRLPDRGPSSNSTGFVAKLNASGSAPAYGTYFGGNYGGGPHGSP